MKESAKIFYILVPAMPSEIRFGNALSEDESKGQEQTKA